MSITSEVSVTDGDSIRMAGIRMRLHGIDAPERHQQCRTHEGRLYTCGESAATHLRKLVDGKQVRCHWEKADRYERKLVTCRADDVLLNERMVADGWALAYRQYSTAYLKAEEQAKKQKAGLWAGSFQKPWEWRQRQRKR